MNTSPSMLQANAFRDWFVSIADPSHPLACHSSSCVSSSAVKWMMGSRCGRPTLRMGSSWAESSTSVPIVWPSNLSPRKGRWGGASAKILHSSTQTCMLPVTQAQKSVLNAVYMCTVYMLFYDRFSFKVRYCYAD